MPALGKGAAAPAPEDPLMSRDQLTRRSRRLLERLREPSSAAGLTALARLPGAPQLAEHAPVLIDLAITVIPIGAAILAMAKGECRDCNGR